MNSKQIFQALSRDNYVRPMFAGVFALDMLPSETEKSAFVINLDPSDKPGSHWVSVFLDKVNSTAIYFDSYGDKSKIPSEITLFLRQNCISYSTNCKMYQGPCSITCGHYCLYFLYHKCRGVPFQDILKDFRPNDFEFNDSKVIDFVDRKFVLKTSHMYDDKCILQVAIAMK